jgi:hypothetical protein
MVSAKRNQTEWKIKMFNSATISRNLVIQLLAIFLVCAATGYPTNAASAAGMPLGETTWEKWQAEAGWPSYSADSFQPPPVKIEDISGLIKQKAATFVIVGGSWCPDTERQLPRIMKILRLALVPPGDIHLYGVDRRKREPSGTAKRWHISRIPTVIIFSHGKEMGRIVENPKVSWEDDILNVLSDGADGTRNLPIAFAGRL